MLVRLDIPQTVLLGRVFVTSNFLLLESPIWKLDFVTEQITSRQCMP